MKVSTFLLLVAVAGITLFATGCPEHKSIADIEHNPSRYQDKEVVIVGRVTDSYGVGLPGTNIGGGAYRIDDGTGSIWVMSTNGNVPTRGTEVGVKGRVSSAINWSGRNNGLGIYEEQRKYKKH